MKQSKAHFHIRKSLRNQSHPLTHIVPPKHTQKYYHPISFLHIYSNQKLSEAQYRSERRTTYIRQQYAFHPCLSSVVLYIFIPLLFRKTSLSLVSTFCRVSGKCSCNSFPASFFAFSCISSYTFHLSQPSSLFSILSNFS